MAAIADEVAARAVLREPPARPPRPSTKPVTPCDPTVDFRRSTCVELPKIPPPPPNEFARREPVESSCAVSLKSRVADSAYRQSQCKERRKYLQSGVETFRMGSKYVHDVKNIM